MIETAPNQRPRCLPQRPPSPLEWSTSLHHSAPILSSQTERDDDKLRPTQQLLDHFYCERLPLNKLFSRYVIFKAGDTPSYARFISTTLVASRITRREDDATWQALQLAKLRRNDSESVGMRDVLAQAHARLFAQHAKDIGKSKSTPGTWVKATPNNVLCFGYRPASLYRSDTVKIGDSGRIVNDYVNTVVGSLSISKDWLTLLRRVGSSAIITLLSSPHLAVFAPLSNGCFMQVAGTALAELKPQEPTDTTASKTHKKRPRQRRSRNRTGPSTRGGSTEMLEVDPVPELTERPTKRARNLVASISEPSLALTTSTQLLPNTTLTQVLPSRSLRTTQSTISLDENPPSPLIERAETRKRKADAGTARVVKRKKLATVRLPSEILLSRSRLYHARPPRTNDSKLVYGMSSKHILRRLIAMYPPPNTEFELHIGRSFGAARHLAKYIFPRQFGLHNVFTYPKPRTNDLTEDYQDREIQIKKLGPLQTPIRVKPALGMLQRMTLLHTRCRYRKLLDHTCPRRVTKDLNLTQAERDAFLELMSQPKTQLSDRTRDFSTDGENSFDATMASFDAHGASQAREKVRAKPKFTEFMVSSYEVIAYVTAVTKEVIPRDFWGSDSNEKAIFACLREFLRQRRFEFMSIHTLLQGFSVVECVWLLPPSSSRRKNRLQKATQCETIKRREVLMEFLIWFFDSFVIDLVRTAFCCTDSATHDKKPIFFRHDDWLAISTPSLAAIQSTMFDPIPDIRAQEMLKDRQLGYSFVRLLPKATGFRPIVNLARRPLITGPFGRRELGKTINKVLQASFDVLTFEKKRQSHLVGSLVSSPMDILERLKQFKAKMIAHGKREIPKLYFVKVDVQGAYDTIKQDKLLEIVDRLLTESDYAIQRFSSVIMQSRRPVRKWQRRACAEDDQGQFEQLAKQVAGEMHNAVLSDQVIYPSVTRAEVAKLLREHITTNLVKFGSHFHKQKDGIPQGSVLSSLLCSLFYGDMELKELGFTRDPQSILLRYVDDFLFITTEKRLAAGFLQVMEQGLPEYGCKISPEKRLTNFDVALHPGELVPPHRNPAFPWCGHTINTMTLDVRADMSRMTDSDITNKLTVQRHAKPGDSFLNSMMLQIKVRCLMLYLDTSHSSLSTVMLNIYQSMSIVAIKYDAYVREWRKARTKERSDLFLHVARSAIAHEWRLIRHRRKSTSALKAGCSCDVPKRVVDYLSTQAFVVVLSYRSNVWQIIIPELKADLLKIRLAFHEREQVEATIRDPSNIFVDQILKRSRRAFLR